MTPLAAADSTIVLVGGPFTLQDGTRMDTRQLVAQDDRSPFGARAAAGSWFWWQAVQSVVLPTLKKGGEDASALISTGRSVLVAKPGESARRRRLARLLTGGVRRIECTYRVGEPSDPDLEGFDRTAREERDGLSEIQVGLRIVGTGSWTYLDDYWNAHIPLAVEELFDVVVAAPEGFPAASDVHELELEAFLRSTFFGKVEMIVLPDTPWVRKLIEVLIGDRTATTGDPPWVGGNSLEDKKMGRLDDDAQNHFLDRMQPVVAEADFQVTGVIRRRRHEPYQPLESARRLLGTRFDLGVGLWDLVDNEQLRSTVLGDVERVEIASPAPMPPITMRQTQVKVDRAEAQRDRKRRFYDELHDVLRPHGWKREQYGVSLALTRLLRSYPNDPPRPWLFLTFDVLKSVCYLEVSWSIVDELIDPQSELDALRPQIFSVAGSHAEFSERRIASWSRGWGMPFDRSAFEETIGQWHDSLVAVLSDLAAACEQIPYRRVERYGLERHQIE